MDLRKAEPAQAIHDERVGGANRVAITRSVQGNDIEMVRVRFGPDGRQFSRRPGNRGGSAPFFAANGEAIVAQTGVRGLKNRLFRLMTKRQKEALFANTARGDADRRLLSAAAGWLHVQTARWV